MESLNMVIKFFSSSESSFSLPLFLIVLCTGACAGPSQVATTNGDEDFVFAPEYRIGVGDNLTVNVFGHEDVSAAVLVRPDGKITMPISGDITVGGKTPEEVARAIKQDLSTYIRDPIVTVTVANVAGSDYFSRVRVTGAVQSPQSLEFKNGMTVMDVVFQAGGVSEFANPSRTRLYREGEQPVRIRLDRVLSGADMSSNIRLRPGDVVSVPERLF